MGGGGVQASLCRVIRGPLNHVEILLDGYEDPSRSAEGFLFLPFPPRGYGDFGRAPKPELLTPRPAPQTPN